MYELKMPNYGGRVKARFIEIATEDIGDFKTSFLYFYDILEGLDFKMRVPHSWNFGESGDEFYITKAVDPRPRWKIERVSDDNLSEEGQLRKKRKDFLNMSPDTLIELFRGEEFYKKNRELMKQLPYDTIVKLRLGGIKT